MPKILINPINKEINVESGANLRSSLIDNGIAVKSTCGGSASCAECIVTIKQGHSALSEVTFEEKQLLGNVFHITAERLSCQVQVLGNIEVDVSLHTEATQAVVSKVHRRTRAEADLVVEERREKSKLKPEKPGGRKRPKAFKD